MPDVVAALPAQPALSEVEWAVHHNNPHCQSERSEICSLMS